MSGKHVHQSLRRIDISNLNPFADPDVISLAELQKRIMANGVVAYPRKREMSSAINTVGVWFGLPLDMIPASATFLRDKFEHVHPSQMNVSKRRVQNVRSLVMSAFRAEGISHKLAPYMCGWHQNGPSCGISLKGRSITVQS
jgi:hypothetical protein